MGLYVEIKQCSLIKKALPPSVILGKALTTRNDIENGCNDICAYIPEHIGRGIYVSWNRKSASVSLPMFALPEEIKEFYNVVDRIAKHWSCTLETDGGETTLSEFAAGLNDNLEFNSKAAEKFLADISHGEITTFPCALYDLTPGRQEAESFAGSPEALYSWLHERQSMDVHFANCGFSVRGGGIRGRFAFTEGVPTVFPSDPKRLKPDCAEFDVNIVSMTERAVIGSLPYDKFISRISKDKVSRFDEKSVLIEAHFHKELEALLK